MWKHIFERMISFSREQLLTTCPDVLIYQKARAKYGYLKVFSMSFSFGEKKRGVGIGKIINTRVH